MDVYVVTLGEYMEGYSCSVFSSLELANSYTSRAIFDRDITGKDCDYVTIEKLELDTQESTLLFQKGPYGGKPV